MANGRRPSQLISVLGRRGLATGTANHGGVVKRRGIAEGHGATGSRRYRCIGFDEAPALRIAGYGLTVRAGFAWREGEA
jgi:hypothetical protein